MTKSIDHNFTAGVFLIDKPVGISSFGVVSRIRKILKIKKVGHAGTLDPFATGLLVVCAGRPATRLIESFMVGEKEYVATIKLGIETTTQDPEGEIVRRRDVGTISVEEFESCLKKFTGKQLQTPPAYSALKHKGKPLYYYARKGIEVKKDPREIEIRELQRVDSPVELRGVEVEVTVRVVCSKGTYIRTLAADIGSYLGCGAHLSELRRTKSGFFAIEEALTWEELTGDMSYQLLMDKMISTEQVAILLQ